MINLRYPYKQGGLRGPYSSKRVGLESETLAYANIPANAPTLSALHALDAQIKFIKYGSGVTISSVTGNISNVAGAYFLTNFSMDIRAYVGFYATLTDTASKTKKVLLGAAGTGETHSFLIGGDTPSLRNGDFSSAEPPGTQWAIKSTGVVVTGGSAVFTDVAVGGVIQQNLSPLVSVGELYKATVAIAVTTGSCCIRFNGIDGSTVALSATSSMYSTLSSTEPSPKVKVLSTFTGTLNSFTFGKVLTPSASGGCWLTPVSEDSGFNPNSTTFTVTLTRS